MREVLVEFVSETVVFAIEIVLAGILTTVGILSEQTGVASVTSGDTLGLWYIYVGALALYGGVYLLGYQRVLPELRARLAGA